MKALLLIFTLWASPSFAMTRYKITNIEDGRKFEVVSEADTLGAAQPEWGKNPVIVVEDMAAELAEAERKKQAAIVRRARVLDLAKKVKAGTITAAERNEALGLLLLDLVRELD
jgi:hypothetical protein